MYKELLIYDKFFNPLQKHFQNATKNVKIHLKYNLFSMKNITDKISWNKHGGFETNWWGWGIICNPCMGASQCGGSSMEAAYIE